MTIISVAHGKGGVGKSNTSLNLAIMLNAYQLIDLDPQNSISDVLPLRDSIPELRKLNVWANPTIDELADIFNSDTDDKTTVIDTGGFDSDLNRLVVAYSDIVITPVSDEPIELVGLRRFGGVLKEIEADMEMPIKTYVLLNKIHPARKRFDHITSFITQSDCFQMLNSVICKRIEISESMGLCQSVEEYKPKSDAVSEYKSLVTEIKSLVRSNAQ